MIVNTVPTMSSPADVALLVLLALECAAIAVRRNTYHLL